MLTILVRGIDEIPSDTINDAEMAFDMIKLTGDEIDRKLVHFVEEGEYLDSFWFIDRFGCKCSISDMSTGCRAALAVHHNPNTPINFDEVGDNAVSELIKWCKEGTIVVPDRPYLFCTVDSEGIDVMYRDYHFTDFDEFAQYMYDWWPEPPAEMVEYEKRWDLEEENHV